MKDFKKKLKFNQNINEDITISELSNGFYNNNNIYESVESETDVKLAVDVKNVDFWYKKNFKTLNNMNLQIPEGMLNSIDFFF
jgi:hypothetical protein